MRHRSVGYAIIIVIVIIIMFIKSCQNATCIHKSITACIEHTHHKIITEELVAFVNKLSVVASCSEIG